MTDIKCSCFEMVWPAGVIISFMKLLARLKDARFYLLALLVFTAPLSLHPSISLPVLNFPSFRIGLYQLLAIAFVLICLPLICRGLLKASKNKLFVLLGFMLAIVFVVGLSQSLVPTRTLLYSGSFLALLLLGFTAYIVFRDLGPGKHRALTRYLLWSGIVFGVLAIGQLLLATFGEATTLCRNCTDQIFGFPRINLFAAEPQFFASSLLPSFFAALLLSDMPRRLRIWSLVFSAVAIGLTFSRGAFFALAAAIIVLAAILAIKKYWSGLRSLVKWTLLAFISVLAGLGLLVASASYIHRDSDHITYNTAASALDHLTLGIIYLPQRVEPSNQPTNPNFQPAGLIEESSDERLGAADRAIDAWNDSPRTLLFGVGMGNLGAYVKQNIIAYAPSDLTVYIFYVLLLAEAGLIGLATFLIIASILIKRLLGLVNKPFGVFMFALITAFVIHFWFFGSYINVMYVYVWAGIAFAYAARHQLYPSGNSRIIDTD